MATWISDGVKARHWTCNALLGIIFVLLVLIDFFVFFTYLMEDWVNTFIIVDGGAALLGGYGFVIQNRTGGLWMGIVACFTLIAIVCIDDIGFYDIDYGMEWTLWEKIYRSLLDSVKFSVLCTSSLFLILLIKNKGKSALMNLENRGMFTKLRYEVILSTIISLAYIAMHAQHIFMNCEL